MGKKSKKGKKGKGNPNKRNPLQPEVVKKKKGGKK
jgi:hypothetical protein